MRTVITLFVSLLVIACSGSPAPRTAEPRRSAPTAAFSDSSERLGALRLGLPAAEVIQALGQPASRGPIEKWGATGQLHQEWRYPAQGITVDLVADTETGPQTVRGLTIAAPCALRTRLGIGIGSSLAEVRKAYGPHESKDAPYDGKRFVAGSLFGGVLFFIEQDRVRSIFVGAAAE
jgi:hypothetical protein